MQRPFWSLMTQTASESSLGLTILQSLLVRADPVIPRFGMSVPKMGPSGAHS